MNEGYQEDGKNIPPQLI